MKREGRYKSRNVEERLRQPEETMNGRLRACGLDACCISERSR